MPDLPREPVAEPLPAAPVPLPAPPAAPVPLRPAAHSRRFADRRKQHQVVRFDRRPAPAPAPVADHPPAREREAAEPVRELTKGRRKHHVVVRFDHGHEFDRVEA